MLKWTGVAFALVLSLGGLGCGGAQHGSVPVDTPLWSPPANDPSATEAADKAAKAAPATDDGDSPAATPDTPNKK